MKQEQHISITLCAVSNDFWYSRPAFSSPEAALRRSSPKEVQPLGREWIPDREIVFVQRMLFSRGEENSVWQMEEYAFLWLLPSPSHSKQSFCKLHDLWIELSISLERRFLKLRTAVALSDIYPTNSGTYARVEAINLGLIYLQQMSHHACT